MAEIAVVQFSEISAAERWDSEYYRPEVKSLVKALSTLGAKPLASFILSAKRGQAPEYNPNGSVPVIRTVNVRDLEFSDARQEFVTQEFLKNVSKGIIRKFNIVVTSTGVGTLGRTFCNVSDDTYFADGHITVLNLMPKEDYAYITAVLQSRIGRIQLERWQRGSSGQIEIYPEDILQILIPNLPNRIRTRVSALWTDAIELVRQSRSFYPEAEKELLERLDWEKLQSQKDELFFISRATELDSVGRADAEHFQPKCRRLREHLLKLGATPLGQVCASIAKGTQPHVYLDDGEVIVVKSKNVFGQGIDFANCERTTLDAYTDIPARLKEGDLVINTTGFGTLGRAAFIPKRQQKVIASVDLVILRLKEIVLPEYAALFLNSPVGLAQSEMFQTGSSGQLHLYPQHIKDILIYLPRNRNGTVDLAWQKKLSDKVVRASLAKQDAQAKLSVATQLVENEIKKVWQVVE